MQPLALLSYENLLTGNQLVNKLIELGYRTAAVPDLDRLAEQAAKEKPLLCLVEVASQAKKVADAVRRLRADPRTSHVPVLAYGKLGPAQADREAAEAVRAAGAHLLAAETGILAQLPQLLEQVLHVE